MGDCSNGSAGASSRSRGLDPRTDQFVPPIADGGVWTRRSIGLLASGDGATWGWRGLPANACFDGRWSWHWKHFSHICCWTSDCPALAIAPNRRPNQPDSVRGRQQLGTSKKRIDFLRDQALWPHYVCPSPIQRNLPGGRSGPARPHGDCCRTASSGNVGDGAASGVAKARCGPRLPMEVGENPIDVPRRRHFGMDRLVTDSSRVAIIDFEFRAAVAPYSCVTRSRRR